MEDIYYRLSHESGFIIRFCDESALYKLYEVPLFGGDECLIGNFLSVDEAKQFADKLT